MGLESLPTSAIQFPIVAPSPQVSPVLEPARVQQLLGASGNIGAVIERAGQDSMARSQAQQQINASQASVEAQQRALDQAEERARQAAYEFEVSAGMQNRQQNQQAAIQSRQMASMDRQEAELYSPEQVEARRGKAIIEALQVKEAQDATPERQALDHYTRMAGIQKARMEPGNLDAMVKAIQLYHGDTSAFDPNSLLPVTPEQRQELVEEFRLADRLDAEQRAIAELDKAPERTRTFKDNASNNTITQTWKDTPFGPVYDDEWETLRARRGMTLPTYKAGTTASEALQNFRKNRDSKEKLGRTAVPGEGKPKLGDRSNLGQVTETGTPPMVLESTIKSQLGSLLSAPATLENVRGTYQTYLATRKAPKEWVPLTGLLAKANPFDYTAQNLTAAVQAAVPEFARGIFREVGVLSDTDVERYRQILSAPTTPEVRANFLFGMLDQKLKRAVTEASYMYQNSTEGQRLIDAFGITPADWAGLENSRSSWFKSVDGSAPSSTVSAGNWTSLPRIDGPDIPGMGKPVGTTPDGKFYYWGTQAYGKNPDGTPVKQAAIPGAGPVFERRQ
jgi:hypothetical protein